ncbi:MAG: hypothetical protein GXY24_02640 [Bacteroidales bacterium]|jgi:hypothetical protein|nr:hypothetical protein [Bacteroidales bacterium]
MKKIFLATALLAISLAAGAQSMYDAITFSQNHYFGTARSMAMGNAVTALGGDLGSIGINPAGSAVSSYGQFVITPGLTISAVASQYSPEGESGYGPVNNLKSTKFNMPNVGVSMTFETGKRYGVKAISFAVLSNQTNSFNYAADAFGNNSRTSKIAEFADAAYGISEVYLPKTNDYNPYDYSDVSWDILTAYNGGMFGPYGWDADYAGVTESISDNGDYHFVPAALAQTSSLTKIGSKSDLIMNFGLNISDRVYVGFNLGVPMIRYRFDESFYEAAVNPELFPIVYEDGDQLYTTYFQRGYYNYQYLADIGGVYAGVGVIVRPTDNLRLGASIQSPTALSVSETWQYMASTTFSDSDYNDSETSPTGEYSYNLRTPYRASFGAAYTFNKMGVVSVDYEMADYSVMRFSPVHMDRMANDEFLCQNMTNQYFAGVAQMLRVGAEFKVTPAFAVRAGYSVSTSPERWWTDSSGNAVTADDYAADFYSYFDRVKNLVTPHYYGDLTKSYSAGLGYSSPGSFFMDAAVRLTQYPTTTFSPYYDYDSYDSAGNLLRVQSPRVLNVRDLWSASLTFGWRF